MKEQEKTRLQIVALTDVGLVRDHNEDNFLICHDLALSQWLIPPEEFSPGNQGCLLVVADGMGGANAGEVASAIAVDGIKQYFGLPGVLKKEPSRAEIQKILKAAIFHAHKNILEYLVLWPDCTGMGTTVVVAWIIDGDIHVCWSGDSRCYLFRSSGEFKLLTEDHSYVQELVKAGKITADQAFYHPDRNIITQHLGHPHQPPNPGYFSIPFFAGDIILLCSDGLNGLVSDLRIKEIISGTTDLEKCVQALIREAKREGGNDNITVVMAAVK